MIMSRRKPLQVQEQKPWWSSKAGIAAVLPLLIIVFFSCWFLINKNEVKSSVEDLVGSFSIENMFFKSVHDNGCKTLEAGLAFERYCQFQASVVYKAQNRPDLRQIDVLLRSEGWTRATNNEDYFEKLLNFEDDSEQFSLKYYKKGETATLHFAKVFKSTTDVKERIVNSYYGLAPDSFSINENDFIYGVSIEVDYFRL